MILVIIKIKEISENALFESDGIKLRNMIMDFCNSNHDEKIQLDFSGITLFATMFFNAWVGYFVKNNREDILNKIEAINISKLGEKTLQHSRDNAEYIISLSDKDIKKIVDESM